MPDSRLRPCNGRGNQEHDETCQVSELILDGTPKTVDITPFRFSRFAEGKLLEGEYGYGNIWK